MWTDAHVARRMPNADTDTGKMGLPNMETETGVRVPSPPGSRGVPGTYRVKKNASLGALQALSKHHDPEARNDTSLLFLRCTYLFER